jgi:short-subunit dehydrogenase
MKTYLIIGAGPGIGIATAERFAKEGFHIVLASRSEKSIVSNVDALRKAGVTVAVETVDAANPQNVAALVRRYGSDLSVMHYNAGLLHHTAAGELESRSLEQETVESLSSDMHINLVSALAATKAAEEVMRPRGQGTILLTGGGLGVDPAPAFINISVAKAGLRAATKALFEPMKNKGIHIATVTVSALVSPGSDKAKEVAEAFWRLHSQPKNQWDWEVVIR